MKKALFLIFLVSFTPMFAQYEIKPQEGFSPQIGIMVSMLEDLKDRITAQVKDLNQEQVDFLFDEKANSVGGLLMHLIATEAYYQAEGLENRKLTEEEKKRWKTSWELGEEGRKDHKGKPIQHYLHLWDEIRQKTLAGLKEKDDTWFASAVEEGINHHWVWYHVMEHQANHMGQIALVKNRLPN